MGEGGGETLATGARGVGQTRVVVGVAAERTPGTAVERAVTPTTSGGGYRGGGGGGERSGADNLRERERE